MSSPKSITSSAAIAARVVAGIVLMDLIRGQASSGSDSENYIRLMSTASLSKKDFQSVIAQGIPNELPEAKSFDSSSNHAPKRKDILSPDKKKLAVRNALRYFPQKFHALLAKEFFDELITHGRIYMYRFRPGYEMFARPIDFYPAKCQQAAAIMLMIQNNLDPRVAQHPH